VLPRPDGQAQRENNEIMENTPRGSAVHDTMLLRGMRAPSCHERQAEIAV
jgi:hypothetical protein